MKKILLLFVLSAGLFGCSENQDLFIEEAVVAGKQKEKNAQVLFDEGMNCGGWQDDIRDVRAEITETERYMEETRARYERGEIDQATFNRRAESGRLIIQDYRNQLNYLKAEYDMCVNS